MGLIREPLEVDFTVDSQLLTTAEKMAITKYIRDYKMKAAEKTLVLPESNKIRSGKRVSVKS